MDFIPKKIFDDQAYMDIIADLITDEKLLAMDKITHHYHTTRLRHNLSVSYVSYKIAQSRGLKAKSVARAGLMHDFFLETRQEIAAMKMGSHAEVHPKIALENARDLTSLSDLEADIILSHMYMSCLKSPKPKYEESFLVSMVDKRCAISEFMMPAARWVQQRVEGVRKVFAMN